MNKGRGRERYTVEGVSSSECPVSAITAESERWLDEFEDAAWMKDSGAAAYGPDLSRWPGRAVDAHKLLQIEQARLETARHEACQ